MLIFDIFRKCLGIVLLRLQKFILMWLQQSKEISLQQSIRERILKYDKKGGVYKKSRFKNNFYFCLLSVKWSFPVSFCPAFFKKRVRVWEQRSQCFKCAFSHSLKKAVLFYYKFTSYHKKILYDYGGIYKHNT